MWLVNRGFSRVLLPQPDDGAQFELHQSKDDGVEILYLTLRLRFLRYRMCLVQAARFTTRIPPDEA